MLLDCGRKAEYPGMSERHIIGSLSYLWPLALMFAGPVWTRTAVHKCNFPHRPPLPLESRHVCCLLLSTFSIQFVHTPVKRSNKSKHVEMKNPLTVHVNIWSYLVPSHLRLLVRSQVIFNIWTGNHFATSYLSFLHIAHSAAEALPLVAGLYGHWHRHFHAVGGIPAQIKHL